MDYLKGKDVSGKETVSEGESLFYTSIIIKMSLEMQK